MWGGEDWSLFTYMRPMDASSVVYVRRTPSELPSARDGQPADRHTVGTHAPQKHVARSNYSFTAKHLFLV